METINTRDDRLVQLVREGCFDVWMADADARAWAADVLAISPYRP